jgi:hypothetical protein
MTKLTGAFLLHSLRSSQLTSEAWFISRRVKTAKISQQGPGPPDILQSVQNV